jgi:hypothetical protein
MAKSDARVVAFAFAKLLIVPILLLPITKFPSLLPKQGLFGV